MSCSNSRRKRLLSFAARLRSPAALLLLLLLGGLAIFPLWRAAYPPLIDYPNHLARSFVLAHLRDPAFCFQQGYSADWSLDPYLTADLALRGLQRLFPIELAGRVFLNLCVLAVPLCAWFFLRQANPDENAPALWALLLSHHAFFLYGFLNFYLGLAFCFLALALWLRWLAAPSLARWSVACAAFLALYFTHLLCFVIAGLVFVAYCVLKRLNLRSILYSGLLFLPAVLLFLHWRRLGGGGSGEAAFHSLREKAANFLIIVQGYSRWLDAATLAALVLFFALAAWRNPEFRWNLRWLGVSAVLFATYWLLPWSYGDGAFVDIRVLPVLFVTVLASVRVGRRGWRLAPLAILIFLMRAAGVTHEFAAWQPELAGLARSFEATPRNARVLPIVEAGDDDNFLRFPFAHFWAYGVIRRGWFSPYLFHIKGIFPLRVQDRAYSPEGFWDLDYEEEPDWDRVRQDYDYVWLYNAPRFSEALDEIGERVYAFGRLTLYGLHKPAPSRISASPVSQRRVEKLSGRAGNRKVPCSIQLEPRWRNPAEFYILSRQSRR